jgi:hypothetical protein
VQCDPCWERVASGLDRQKILGACFGMHPGGLSLILSFHLYNIHMVIVIVLYMYSRVCIKKKKRENSYLVRRRGAWR